MKIRLNTSVRISGKKSFGLTVDGYNLEPTGKSALLWEAEDGDGCFMFHLYLNEDTALEFRFLKTDGAVDFGGAL